MKRIELSEDDWTFLKELQHELNTQTTDGNAQPVYWGVMETNSIAGPEGFGEAQIIVDGQSLGLSEAIEHIKSNVTWDEFIDEEWKEIDKSDINDVFEFLKTYVDENAELIWTQERDELSRQTGAFITKRACAEYIKNCGYNHTNPRTYALTAYRNFELERLLNILKTVQFKED